MPLILHFPQLSKSDSHLAGGKGASLGEMTSAFAKASADKNAGIPVPPGFVVLSSAFEQFLQETDLDVEIDSILHSVNHQEIHTVEHASETIQKLILEAQMPKSIEKAIKKEFKKLKAKYVAVRSSATAEDSSSAAWAGQLETYLNTQENTLLQNVQKCFASLFTPRAIFYRFEKGLHNQKISVAVVIQKMIASEKSGIAFSVHPVTEDRNQLIIEAGYGLGESIVSGQITPDSYVVEKAPRRIIDKNISEQTKMLQRKKAGGSPSLKASAEQANEWVMVPYSKQKKQVLSDPEIRELSDLILKIENHYGTPQDIEWAYEKGRFYIVQSRPVTTLSPSQTTKTIETKRNLIKKYALDNSTWTYKGFHGVLHTFFPVGRTGPAMKDFFGDGTKITIFFVKDNYVHWYWNDNDLTRIREKFLKRLQKDSKYLEKLKNKWEIKIKRFDVILRKIDKTDFQKLSDHELTLLYESFYERYVDQFKCFMALGDAVSMHADRYLTPEFQKVLGKDFETVFPKLFVTKYLSFIEEENIEREKLLEILKKRGSLSVKDLESHARKFFYIQNNYAKGIRLSGDDFRKIIYDELKKNIKPTKDTRKQQLEEKQKLIKKYELSQWHKTLLYITDEFFKIQDTRKKYVLISNYYQFEFLKEAERRGGIPFKLLQYSIYPEFQKILEKKVNNIILEKRREICVCIHSQNAFEVVYGLDAQNALDFFQKGIGEQKELKGMIASTGKVSGRVKKILKIHDMANMEKGDVLVSSMTRPEMVPAMKLAVAIITDEGGVTSHAAIISRELGIPCIIGTKIATQVLQDGDLVEVDANKGVVKILKRAEEETIVTLKSKTKNAKDNINDIVEQFAKTKWHFVHKRTRSPFYTSLIWEGIHLKTKTDIPFDYTVAEAIYLDTELAIEESSWETLRKRVVNFIKHNPDALSNLLRENYKINEKVEKFAQKTKKQVGSLENLCKLWNEYRNLMHLFGAYIALPLFIEADLEKELKNAVTEKYGKKSEEVYQILTTPIKSGSAQEEELALLKLAILKNKNKLRDNDISAHLEKFSWIANNAFNGNFMTKRVLEERIKQVSKNHPEAHLKNYTKKIKNHEREFEKYYNNFSKNSRTQGIIDVLQESIFYRSWRTERYYRNAYYMQDMFAKTADILGMKNTNDIFYLTITEIIEALENNAIPAGISISERKTGYVCFAFDNKVVAYSGEKLKLAKQSIQLQKISKDTKEIKGQTAYPGKVRGIVLVVISKDDLKSVKEKSVLVSPSTTVDYVPVLKKVIAIVTEEGGVLSHASVISRELHIPCIIGTKIATQVLQDGDLVEVDAERGIVTIIEKADTNNSGKNIYQSKNQAESRSFRKGGADKGVVKILKRAGEKSRSIKNDIN